MTIIKKRVKSPVLTAILKLVCSGLVVILLYDFKENSRVRLDITRLYFVTFIVYIFGFDLEMN